MLDEYSIEQRATQIFDARSKEYFSPARWRNSRWCQRRCSARLSKRVPSCRYGNCAWPRICTSAICQAIKRTTVSRLSWTPSRQSTR